MRRGTAVVLAAVMMVFGALPGLARETPTEDRATRDRVPVDVADRPVDRPSDQVVDEPRPVESEADRPTTDRPADVRPVDVERPTDRVRDHERDRVRDRETDRHCVDFVTDRRCIDDRHPHVNLRHLIQRLIHAGEWEKLFRLLHRLGII